MSKAKKNIDPPLRPSSGRRLHGIEGLRGLAATTVLIGHVSVHLASNVRHPDPLGTVLNLMGQGLTLFFALSGFLLFRPFVRGILDQDRRPSVKDYFVNRCLRIYPAYILILAVVSLILGKAYTAPISPNAGVEGAAGTVGYLTDPLVLIANALMIHTWFPATIKTGLGVSWTLTVELVFYLALPILAVIFYRFADYCGRFKCLFAVAPVVIILGIGLAGKYWVSVISDPATPEESFFLNWGGNWTAVLARSFVAHADLFAFGMLGAFIYVLVESGVLSGRSVATIRWTSAAVGVLAVLLTEDTVLRKTGFGLGAAALILFVVLSDRAGRPGIFAKALELRPIQYVGIVSYSLYLWHVPVIWLLRDLGLTFSASPWGLWGNVSIVFILSFALSALTYELVESRAMKFKKHPARLTSSPSILEPGR